MFAVSLFMFFFFKQKTAYDMRISDWSSDVCSSDLHEQQAVAFHCRARRAEIERHDLDAFQMDILPDIKLGPVTDREDAHRFAFGFARIVQPPQFGTLALRVPAVIGRTEGKDTLLGAALLFIAPRGAEGSVKAVLFERLLQALGL